MSLSRSLLFRRIVDATTIGLALVRLANRTQSEPLTADEPGVQAAIVEVLR